MMDEQTNWEAVKKVDWKTINQKIISEEKEGFRNESNKSKLLHLILAATGIKFTDIMMSGATDQLAPREFRTNATRPELGVCTRWIDEFQFGLYQFGLYSRDPQTITMKDGTVDVYLSYCPSLGYNLIEGGSNGFNVKAWFYYDCQRQEWFVG